MWPGPGFFSGAAEWDAMGLRPARQGWGPSVSSSLDHTSFCQYSQFWVSLWAPDFGGIWGDNCLSPAEHPLTLIERRHWHTARQLPS